jgi:hypothetical protein
MKSWLVFAALGIFATTVFWWEKRANDSAMAELRKKVSQVEREPPTPIDRPAAPMIAYVSAPSEPPSAAEPTSTVKPAAAPTASAAQHAPTNEEVRDHYEMSFIGEYADAAWSQKARGLASERLKATLPDSSAVRSIDCRTSMCRIETSHADLEHYRQFVQKSFMDPESSIWNAATYSSITDDSSGNLVVVSYVSRDGQPLPPMDATE